MTSMGSAGFLRFLAGAVRLAVIAVAAWAAAGFGGAARAEYELCNRSSYVMTAAIGYADAGALVTRGWWRLRPGECRTVMTEPVIQGRYFVYAEAIPGHQGELRTWSGRTPLCVQNDSLFTLRDQDVCADDPRRQREFFTVDIPDGNDGTWSTEFFDTDNYSTFASEVAGVQRLLSDVGVYSGSIDGELGEATRRAISQYQANKGLPRNGNVSGTLVDTLIEDANSVQAQLGFVMCNSTMWPVWAAFAQPTGAEDGYMSSGWWWLDANDCAKVRRGTLTEGSYYVYAVMEAENRSMPLAGGDQEFCVSAVQFEAQGAAACEEEGFDRAKFRRIDISSTKSTTFEFKAEHFNPELVDR